jgi:hypothetical protein
VLPFIFLVVTLLGGMRIGSEDGAFIFIRPALVCLIFALLLIILFVRGKVIRIGEWFSEDFPLLKNLSNGVLLLTLFAASTQIFNSVLPEKGLAFWLFGFFFFWTLWNNLFVDFKPMRLLQNLGGTLGLAFVVKYLLLANLSTTGESTWTQKILDSVVREASLGMLDIEKFAPATGYLQFFTLIIFALGIFLAGNFKDSKKERTVESVSDEED